MKTITTHRKNHFMGTPESTIIVAFTIFMLLLVMTLGYRKLSFFVKTKGVG